MAGELVLRETLKVEQGRQVAVVDAKPRRRRDPRPGPERHPGAGGREHWNVVRPVSHRESIGGRDRTLAAQPVQDGPFGVGPEHRVLDRSRKPAVDHHEAVGVVIIEPGAVRHRSGDRGEAARDQRCPGAVRAHRADQYPGAGRQRDPLFNQGLKQGRGVSREQPDPLAQGGLEVDLATHGPVGDRCHPLAQPCHAGELVERLLTDDGRIHVGDEKAPAASRRRLDGDIHPGAGKCAIHARADRVRRRRGQHEVKRAAVPEPGGVQVPCARRMQRRNGLALVFGAERARDRVRRQGEGILHCGGVLPIAGAMDSRPQRDRSPVIAVAGPTAGGKSELAVRLAETLGGTVINSDAMQVYRELRILTSRPGGRQLARAPHRLYGFRPIARPCSVAEWLDHARAEIAAAQARGSVPVICGGTGLYLRALLEGLAPVPDIPDRFRRAAQARLAAIGGAAFRRELADGDPETAARLTDGDTQRLVRAREVLEATGRPLADWQREQRTAGEPDAFVVLVLPPREATYAACDARFDAMLERGALEEARAIAGLGLDPSLPGMKAIGLPELLEHLAGRLSLEQAGERARRHTRRYAKRQATWFRHQLHADRVVPGMTGDAGVWAGLLGELRGFLSLGGNGLRVDRIRPRR